MSWRSWGLGFLAGAALASWLTLSCADGNAQSPEVSEAIHQSAVAYGVSESWMRRLLWCESRFRPDVTSRGGHMGIAQYAPATWRYLSARAGWNGASPYDPVAAVDVLGWSLAHGYASHWACSGVR